MKNKSQKAKEPVRLRSKRIRNGNHSLYLDIYTEGKRRYEFLRLYIVPEHSKEDCEHNRRAWRLANTVKNRRIIELQNGRYGFIQSKIKANSNLLDYLDLFAQKHKEAYRGLLMGLKNHLIRYKGNVIKFRDIDKHFLVGLNHYFNQTHACGNVSKKVLRPLSQGSKWNYFNVLSRLLNKACREGYLSLNPMHELATDERPQRAEPRKTFLIMDEVRKLAETPLKWRVVKQAFLFSCLCGLRFSDIRRLRWEDLRTDSKGNVIAEIIQRKTGILLYLPISTEALKQLPYSDTRTGLIFKGMPDASYTTKILKVWTSDAGLNKKVTFHVARHTFATLGLTYGAELYTISKLLGHSNIKVTQIYADIISEKKMEAVNAIPPIK